MPRNLISDIYVLQIAIIFCCRFWIQMNYHAANESKSMQVKRHRQQKYHIFHLQRLLWQLTNHQTIKMILKNLVLKTTKRMYYIILKAQTSEQKIIIISEYLMLQIKKKTQDIHHWKIVWHLMNQQKIIMISKKLLKQI